jgi:hypothetical protein
MSPAGYTEDALVERPAIDLPAELEWKTDRSPGRTVRPSDFGYNERCRLRGGETRDS